MRKASKAIVYLLVATIGLSALTACGSSSGSDKGSDKGTKTEKSNKKTKKARDKTKEKEEEVTDGPEENTNYKKSSVIYINNTRFDLMDWKDKEIVEIIDELESTGMQCSGIDGASGYNYSKARVDVSREDIMKAIGNLDEEHDYVELEFAKELGTYHSDCDLKLRANNEVDSIERLSLDIMLKAEDMDVSFELGDERLKATDLATSSGEDWMKTGMFDSVSEKGDEVHAYSDDYSVNVAIYKESETYARYSFELKHLDKKIDKSFKDSNDIGGQNEEIINNLGEFTTSSTTFNLRELADADLQEVTSILQGLGVTDQDFEFTSTNHEDKDIAELVVDREELSWDEMQAKINDIMEAHSNDTDKKKHSVESLYISGDLENGMVIRYTQSYYNCKLTDMGVGIICTDVPASNIEWTKEKVKVNALNKDKIAEILTGVNKNNTDEYELTSGDYSIWVTTARDNDDELASVYLKKNIQ